MFLRTNRDNLLFILRRGQRFFFFFFFFKLLFFVSFIIVVVVVVVVVFFFIMEYVVFRGTDKVSIRGSVLCMKRFPFPPVKLQKERETSLITHYNLAH